jgi:hypothetical protein
LALSMFEQAERCAKATGRQPCEFAVSMEELWSFRVTAAEVRCLVEQGYCRARDVNGRPMNRLPYTSATCFLLTAEGSELCKEVGGHSQPAALRTPPLIHFNGDSAAHQDVPHWDAILRELSLGSILVKRFRGSAPRQEMILAALQAAAWERWIKNPLPRGLGERRAAYFRAAIHRLNSHHVHPALHFEADGRAAGVFWTRRAKTA